jgi:hypothetical protein
MDHADRLRGVLLDAGRVDVYLMVKTVEAGPAENPPVGIRLAVAAE